MDSARILMNTCMTTFVQMLTIPLFDSNYLDISLYKYIQFTPAIIQSQAIISLHNSFLLIVIFNLLRPTCPPQPSPPAPLHSILRSLRHPQHISNRPYCPPTLVLLPETAVRALY